MLTVKSAAVLAAWIVLVACATARAEWPSRVFAPYMYIGADDNFKLTECDDACGLKHYTLAFIIARQEGRGKDVRYFKEPAWDGRFPLDDNLYKDQIDAIRARGGDVIISFGGQAGRELGIIVEDPLELEKTYQSIIDRYQFTWLDFDIEGSNLEKNPDANKRRNTVLAALQQKNPGLRISYTLPVDPNGISEASQAMLADAKTQGVRVYSANLMVMYFGKKFINKGRTEGELGIDSANRAYEQIQKIDPTIKIGLCPCLGNNGSRDEVFTLEDAKTLKAFADATPWVVSLHYWSINDDSGRPRRRVTTRSTTQLASTRPAPPPRTPWAFANIFRSFTSR
jgi:chitinase